MRFGSTGHTQPHFRMFHRSLFLLEWMVYLAFRMSMCLMGRMTSGLEEKVCGYEVDCLVSCQVWPQFSWMIVWTCMNHWLWSLCSCWQVCLVFCSQHHLQSLLVASCVCSNDSSLLGNWSTITKKDYWNYTNLHPPTPTGSGLFGAPNANPYSGKSRVAGFALPISSLTSK